jgi:hypothetical protein
MKYYLFLFIYSIPIALYSQNTKGTITDTEQQPIPYATVSIKNTNKGCFSDDAGAFLLTHPLNEQDTLLISCIGYQTAVIAVSQIKWPYSVCLDKSNHALKAVTIEAHKRKLIKVKDNKRVSISARLTKGMELITYIDIRKGSTLNDVTFYCQRSSAARLLAVRVYNMNYKGEPGKCIIPENRVEEIGAFRNQFTFNLKDLNITAEQNGMYVGVQFIEINQLDTPQRTNPNPLVYFSTKNNRNRSYLRSFENGNFIINRLGSNSPNITDKPVNLQCSYSYFAP